MRIWPVTTLFLMLIVIFVTSGCDTSGNDEIKSAVTLTADSTNPGCCSKTFWAHTITDNSDKYYGLVLVDEYESNEIMHSDVIHSLGQQKLDMSLCVDYNNTPGQGQYWLKLWVSDQPPGAAAKLSDAVARASAVDPVTLPNWDWWSCQNQCEINSPCSFSIYVYRQGINIPEGSCVYINTAPSMPLLKAYAVDVPDCYLRWSLNVTYNRSGRMDDTTIEVTLPSDSIWEIYQTLGALVIGGEASVKCQPTTQDCESSLQFSIRAFNPDTLLAERYISDSIPGVVWYWIYVAMHESDRPTQGRYYAQFNEVGASNCDDQDVKYTPNASNVSDGGFGIYQLTNIWSRPPNTQELWSWKENVKSGTGWLLYHKNGWEADYYVGADEYMMRQRFIASQEGCAGPPDHTSGNVTFVDGTSYVIEDAVAIKRYNGATHQYCVFDTLARPMDWFFYESQVYWHPDGTKDTSYYVYDVCSLVQ